MTKKIIYEEKFLVSGMMCHESCATMTRHMLAEALENEKILPRDLSLSLDYEALRFGISRLEVIIESEAELDEEALQKIRALLSRLCKETIPFFDPEKDDASPETEKTASDWINIGMNILAIILIITLWALFPPSLPLVLGLTAIAFAVTAFSARKYLMNFFQNLYHKTLTAMPTAISLGWFLSLAHSLYHGISMPLASSASMMFMSYLMPILLVTTLNGMDLLKAKIMQKSVKMQVQGLQKVFPQMAETYPCYDLLPETEAILAQQIALNKDRQLASEYKAGNSEIAIILAKIVQDKKPLLTKKAVLKENRIIIVKNGQCFPVDGYLLQDNVPLNSAIETGKFHERRQMLDFVPAGAVNLGPDVLFHVQKTAHDSTINRMFLVANRDIEKPAQGKAPAKEVIPQKFAWLYSGLIIAGILAAIIIPLALGIFTVPLLLQNLTGILFSICPCTLAIAHELPKLFSVNQRYNQGIRISEEDFMEKDFAMDILVFDKTGTLTTGNSQVDSFSGDISAELWQRIYLLEKAHGRGHPLAKALMNYSKPLKKSTLIRTVESPSITSRGLSAVVQGISLDLGSADYLQSKNIAFPPDFDNVVAAQTARGYSAVCLAENGCYKGVIFIRHEPRENIIPQLQALHREGKQLIMLTGDSQASAEGFGKQFGNIFHRIEGNQKPENKESYLAELIQKNKSKKVWFFCDGLNDILCARKASELGGVSCAMNSGDPAAFFSDISFNGSLDYLFHHHRQNRFHEKIVLQNQGIMIYSSLIFLAFIITFSIAGIAVSPLIPMLVMVATTGFTLFNTYRAKLSVDVALDKTPSLLKQALVSDFSLALLLLGTGLLVAAILTATVASGGLALPVFTFTAGIAMACSSAFLLSAIGMLATFALVFGAQILTEKCLEPKTPDFEPLDPSAMQGKRVYETVRNFPEEENTMNEPARGTLCFPN